VNNSGPCEDGNACTVDDVCINGICTGKVVHCDDADVCNGFEWCDPWTGSCNPGVSPLCEDGNPCTDDACDAQLGCLFVNNANPCVDGSLCTSNDVCRDGTCTGIPVVCTDGNVCNGEESCNPATGACLAGSPLPCSDGNPCTDDLCDPVLGCIFSNNTAPCNDGSACTTDDTCANGVCVGNPLPCDDGDVCNGAELCDALTGACLAGTPPNCDDQNDCTLDGCDPVGGCFHTVTGSGTVCLIESISSTLVSVDAVEVGGSRRRTRLQTRIANVRTMLGRAATTSNPALAARRYRAAYRGLNRFQATVRRGIFRWNFDVTIANQLIGQAGDVMVAVQELIA
jgi:hypothetical protein